MENTASTVTEADDPLRAMVTVLLRDPGELTSDVLHRGIAALRRYLHGRYSPPLTPADLEEIAGDAVTRFMERRDGIDPSSSPVGYLIKIASNEALTAIRRGQRMVLVDTAAHRGFLALSDAQAIAQLDKSATPLIIEDAMAYAYQQRDATAVRVATYLLDQIQRTGEAPSSRVAAEALGLSHEGVGKALRRLRTYIATSQRQE
jgi:DNA-directed RNA polymerase specialized sigma24 family protein